MWMFNILSLTVNSAKSYTKVIFVSFYPRNLKISVILCFWLRRRLKSCVLIWNGEKCDRKWFSVIKNGRRQPFCEKNKSCVLIWNGEKYDRKWFSVIQNGRRQPFCEQNKKSKSYVLIWNGEKCHRKWFSVFQNGRRQPFSEKKIKIKVAYWSEMARNAIETDFRSSKMAAGSHFMNKI